MMKTCLIFAVAATFLCSCTDNKAVQKKLMDDIMATHEKVMVSEDKLMENKMIIDSLLKADRFDPKDSAAKKAGMRLQQTKLIKADEAMDDWMHNFDPNARNRNGDAKLTYLQQQNKLILKVDTMVNDAIKTSSLLLTPTKK